MNAYEAFAVKCIEVFAEYARTLHEYIEMFAKAYGYRGARGKFSIRWDTYYFIYEYSEGRIQRAKSGENYDTAADILESSDPHVLEYIAG